MCLGAQEGVEPPDDISVLVCVNLDDSLVGDNTETPDCVPRKSVLTTEVENATVTEFNWE
jgi:hypothetical protein